MYFGDKDHTDYTWVSFGAVLLVNVIWLPENSKMCQKSISMTDAFHNNDLDRPDDATGSSAAYAMSGFGFEPVSE